MMPGGPGGPLRGDRPSDHGKPLLVSREAVA
jgi:hypothetical protein